MYCVVKDCRHNRTHLTAAHKCGTCGQLGHGSQECNNIIEINKLNQKCTIDKCLFPNTHLTVAHICSYCKQLEQHEILNCPQYQYNINNPFIHFDYLAQILNNELNICKYKKVYTRGYAGMGHYIYVKHNDIYSPYSFYLMDESGSSYDDPNILNNFIKDYKYVPNNAKYTI